MRLGGYARRLGFLYGAHPNHNVSDLSRKQLIEREFALPIISVIASEAISFFDHGLVRRSGLAIDTEMD